MLTVLRQVRRFLEILTDRHPEALPSSLTIILYERTGPNVICLYFPRAGKPECWNGT